MIAEYDILESNMRKQSHAEFNVTLLNFAEYLENHEFWKVNWADYVAGAERFRSHAALLKEVGVPADRGDSAKKAERDAARALSQLHLDTAVKFMVVRAVHKQDPTLLQDAPLPRKATTAKQQKHAAKKSGAHVEIGLKVRHARGENGAVVVIGQHIRGGGPYLLQICKGEPTSEQSWYSQGGHYNSCSKIIVRNLEPANRYYFRMRTDGPEGPGPFSQSVNIIVL